jgi:hypothetical protein
MSAPKCLHSTSKHSPGDGQRRQQRPEDLATLASCILQSPAHSDTRKATRFGDPGCITGQSLNHRWLRCHRSLLPFCSLLALFVRARPTRFVAPTKRDRARQW